MPAITSLGIGSGLDINSMVTQLVALERRPLSQMQAQASSLQTQVSSYGKLTSQFSALQSASNKLTSLSLWNQFSTTSSNEQAVTATATGGAAAGSYAVQVQKLATSQATVSGSALASSSDLVGEGTLTFEVGSWDAGQTQFDVLPTFTPVTLAVTAADSLGTLRDKINGLDMGVRAAIITDASGTRLSLRSTGTGTEAGFRITASDVDGPANDGVGLSRFATTAPGDLNGMQITQVARNAQATVNNIPVESATNELSGVIDGVTLRLRQETSSDVEVAVEPNREAVKTAVKAFADAYNDLAKTMADQTKYDAASGVGGPLQGDGTVGSLQRQLRAVLNSPSGASSSFQRLSDIGLELQRDGSLKVDSDKLDAAALNLPELKLAFANNDTGNTANNGFARRYADLATQLLGVDGSLTARTEGLRDSLTRNSTDQERLNARVERFQQRLVAQYTAMDANLSRMNSLSSYLTQQLSALSSLNIGSSSSN